MSTKAIIVSGSDDRFFPLLDDLVASVSQNVQITDLDVGVYDFGLSRENSDNLRDRGVSVLDPGWDLQPPNVERAPFYKKYVTAAPFAARHFPGYDVYVWIDADAWVQTTEAIELLIAGALKSGMAACQEADRHYPIPLSGGRVQAWPLLSDLGYRRGVVTWQYKMFRKAFGLKVANETFFRPVINAGVYAIARDAPHWGRWAETLERGLSGDPRKWSDQVSLNFALYAYDLPIELLPARCNWLCSLCDPVFDTERGLLVEPMLPHDPIGIIHLINKAKQSEHVVRTIQGDMIPGGLTFRRRPGRL